MAANMRIWDSVLSHFSALKGLAGAAYVDIYTKVAGEENEGSSNNSLLRTVADSKMAIVSGTAYADIYNGDSRLLGLMATAAGDVITLTADDEVTEYAITLPTAFIFTPLPGWRSDQDGGTKWEAKIASGDVVWVWYREGKFS